MDEEKNSGSFGSVLLARILAGAREASIPIVWSAADAALAVADAMKVDMTPYPHTAIPLFLGDRKHAL